MLTPLLKHFINEACNIGPDNLAIIPPAIGKQLKELDPLEEFYHVDLHNQTVRGESKQTDHDKEVCYLYRIQDWRQCHIRREEQRARYERARRADNEFKENQQRRSLSKDSAVTAAKFRLNQAGKTDKEITTLINQCLQGDNIPLAERLGLKEFIEVPLGKPTLEDMKSLLFD